MDAELKNKIAWENASRVFNIKNISITAGPVIRPGLSINGEGESHADRYFCM